MCTAFGRAEDARKNKGTCQGQAEPFHVTIMEQRSKVRQMQVLLSAVCGLSPIR